MAKTNPLDAFANTPASFPRDFRIPPMPKFSDSLSGKSLPQAVAAHDAALEQWRQSFERSIAERIQIPLTTAAVTTVTPAAASVTTPGASFVAPVTSVNSKVGDVQLTTDDIPQGLTNAYMTASGWTAFFDKYGYHRNYVGPGEMLFIPGQRNAVIAGPLVIDGTLTIDGHLAVVKSG